MESQLLTHIDERIILSGRDTRYPLEAYSFVLASLDYHKSKEEDIGHILASKLASSASELALVKFGPLAEVVFEKWKIKSAIDIGNIVYNLIDIEVLSKSKEDSLDDFSQLPPLFQKNSPAKSFDINKKSIKIFKDA